MVSKALEIIVLIAWTVHVVPCTYPLISYSPTVRKLVTRLETVYWTGPDQLWIEANRTMTLNVWQDVVHLLRLIMGLHDISRVGKVLLGISVIEAKQRWYWKSFPLFGTLPLVASTITTGLVVFPFILLFLGQNGKVLFCGPLTKSSGLQSGR